MLPLLWNEHVITRVLTYITWRRVFTRWLQQETFSPASAWPVRSGAVDESACVVVPVPVLSSESRSTFPCRSPQLHEVRLIQLFIKALSFPFQVNY